MLPTNPLLGATAPAGPHLPTATLRQYAAGTLSGAARHRVEAHALACPRCADILDGLLQTPPATTDQALAQLQQRLRLRVQQAETVRSPLPRLSHRWLVPQLAAAATLLFGLLAGGWYIWQQRHASPAAEVATTRPAQPASSAPAAPATAVVPATAPADARRVAEVGRLPARGGRPALVRPRRPAAAIAGRPLARAAGRASGDSVRTAGLVAAVAPPPATPEPAVTASDAPTRPLASDSAGLASAVVSRAPMRKVAEPEGGRTRLNLMPAAPAIPPTPAGGYAAWREKIRREAAEFKPEDGQAPLSGAVQLRLLIGADGKIQQIKVLHGLRADYDEAAQELVCDSASWIPGIGGGKRAAQAVDVSVPF